MHDPMTQAFEIYGIRGLYNKWKREREYRKTGRFPFGGSVGALARIWHVDSQKGGSDDSCGYSRPKLNKAQRQSVDNLASLEGDSPWFQKVPVRKIDDPVYAESVLRGAFIMVARVIGVKISVEEATRWSIEMIHNPTDNFRSSLAFLPGWHSNSDSDRKADREYSAGQFFYSIGSYILRERRRWYRHPRWHMHHWKIQIPFLQKFKRWAFSRCSNCGAGFKWGETGVSGNWDSTGPLWFKAEKNFQHMGCSSRKVRKMAEDYAAARKT